MHNVDPKDSSRVNDRSGELNISENDNDDEDDVFGDYNRRNNPDDDENDVIEVIHDSDDNDSLLFEELDSEDSDDIVTDIDAMEVDDSSLHINFHHPVHSFVKHDSEVYWCDIDCTSRFAVTGGQDDKAYIWDISTQNVIFQCPNHKESVTSASFNHNSSYVATGDLDGLIQVWKLPENNLVWSTNVNSVEWLVWHKQSNILFAAEKLGEIYMWKIPNGQCKVLVGSGYGSECGILTPDGLKMVVGYQNGTIVSFDLKTGTNIATYQFAGCGDENNIVTDIDIHPNNEMFVAGFTSGLIVVGSITSHREFVKLETNASVEAVRFTTGTEIPLIIAGTEDGIKAWNFSSGAVRYEINSFAINKIIYDESRKLIYAASSSGQTIIVNARSGDILCHLKGSLNNIYHTAVSGDRKFLLTVGAPNHCDIYDLESILSSL